MCYSLILLPLFVNQIINLNFLCTGNGLATAQMGMILPAMMAASALTVPMLVMAAHRIRIIVKLTGKIGLYLRIRISLCAREQGNPRFCQRASRTAADAAADQYIHIALLKQSCQRSVALPVRSDHFTLYYLPVFHIIYLELLRMSKMLEHLTILIRYCNSHNLISPSYTFCYRVSASLSLKILWLLLPRNTRVTSLSSSTNSPSTSTSI